jgi:hypothetical protein
MPPKIPIDRVDSKDDPALDALAVDPQATSARPSAPRPAGFRAPPADRAPAPAAAPGDRGLDPSLDEDPDKTIPRDAV